METDLAEQIELPSAWGLRTSAGTLHTLSVHKDNVEILANRLNERLVPLYERAPSQAALLKMAEAARALLADRRSTQAWVDLEDAERALTQADLVRDGETLAMLEPHLARGNHE